MSIYKLKAKSNKHSNGDGYITRSGHTMFQQDIVADLQRKEQLEKENRELRDALRQLYHNHGHGNHDEACGLWGVIGAQKRPDETSIHRFWGVKLEGGEG